MRRSLPDADDTPCSGVGAGSRTWRRGRYDGNCIADQADGRPALFLRTRVRSLRHQGIGEHQLGGLEAETVFLQVGAILVRTSWPANATGLMSIGRALRPVVVNCPTTYGCNVGFPLCWRSVPTAVDADEAGSPQGAHRGANTTSREPPCRAVRAGAMAGCCRFEGWPGEAACPCTRDSRIVGMARVLRSCRFDRPARYARFIWTTDFRVVRAATTSMYRRWHGLGETVREPPPTSSISDSLLRSSTHLRRQMVIPCFCEVLGEPRNHV